MLMPDVVFLIGSSASGFLYLWLSVSELFSTGKRELNNLLLFGLCLVYCLSWLVRSSYWCQW